jgi:ketosteroid isomerase-like protein
VKTLDNKESNLKTELNSFYNESITGRRPDTENLFYKKPSELGHFTQEEQENLRIVIIVIEELKAWDSHDLDRLYAVMDEDIIYHDITLPPAKRHEGLKEFTGGWLKAAPDFTVFIEKFIVKGNYVVNVGRISGTITGEYFGRPAPNKPFGCMYCQVAVVENGKIKYIRDHWDSYTMIQQMGWSK